MSERPFSDLFQADVPEAAEIARRRVREGDGPALARAILLELSGQASWRRQRALERLAALDDYAPLLAPFAEALADGSDPERRNAARSALSALAAPDAANPNPAVGWLAGLAEENADPDVRVLAVAALGEAAQPRARALLERLLLDPDPNVASAAAEALGQLADPRAVPALLEATTSGDFWTRAAAVVALGRLRDPRALPALARAVAEPWLASAAAHALGEIGEPEGLAALRRALAHGGETRDAALRAAASILGHYPGEEAPDWLRDALRGSEARLTAELEAEGEPDFARLLGLAGTPAAAGELLDQLALPGRKEVGAIGLALLPEAVAREAILRRLGSAGEGERALLLGSLPPLSGADEVRAAAGWLSDPDAETRAAAAEALGRSDRAAVLEALPALLENPDARVGAARVFGYFGTEACAPLVDLLSDPEARVRAVAAEGLGRCGDLHLPRIREALGRESDARARQALASALGRIGGEEAAAALLPWAAADDPALRFAAVRALGESGADAAYPALLEALLDPLPEIQAAALRGLGELGDARAETPLTERLRDPDRDLRRTAVLALDRLSHPGALERLREALSDSDREVRLTAVRALQRLPDPRSEEALQRVADSDSDPHVRQAAARAADRLERNRGEGKD